MGWSSAFLAGLAGGHETLYWSLECVRSPLGGSTKLYSSQVGLGGPARISGAPTMASSRIQPVSWQYSSGEWSVTIAGEDAARVVRDAPRGSIVRLLMGFDPSALEPVCLGVIRNVFSLVGQELGYRISCWDLATALQSRLTTDPDELDLFYDIDQSTTIAVSAYTVGDATLDVADASSFQRETGGNYCVLVTPDSGSDFYLTASGRAGNQFTGVSATGQFGTTAGNASIGNAVANVALLEGHPIDIARRILTSGSGTGDYDDYPDDWGLGLPDDFMDHDDIDDIRDRVMSVSSGSYDLQILVTEAQSDAWAWLSSILAVCGVWPVTRQGSISFRAAQDHEAPKLATSTTIRERDLLEGDSASWQMVGTDFTVEYGTCRTQSATGSVSAKLKAIETHPSQWRYTYDLTTMIWTNESAIRTEINDRLKNWVRKPLEAFDFKCRGWRLAKLVPGDFIRLDLPRLTGRRTAYNQDYQGCRAIVAEVAPDLAGHSTRVRVYPEREA